MAFTHAFLWRHGRMIDLGISGSFSYATAINNRGEVVGFRSVGGSYRAFLWRNGSTTDLGTFGGNDSFATSINDRGEIAGYSSTPDGPFHAFVWRAGVLNDLGTLSGGHAYAYGINERGQVVGQSTYDGVNFVPVMWQNGRILVLGNNRFGVASAVNDRGQVAGRDVNDGSGFLWDRGQFVPLLGPDQSPVFFAQVNDVNNRAWVVGALPFDAVLWRAGTLITLPGLGGTTGAVAINARGQVVGSSVAAGGGTRAVLWTRVAPHAT